MAEQPPLSRIHVVGYSANDRDFPILNLVLDPRVAGYQVPKDLSACPDKRYPNHVFTGAQPIAGDQRVRHVWEILPSPWVPFTRYDDDLGPIQGRRRSVKNEGQVASLASDKRVTYEAREGSAIVYTELEETWSIKVDEDGNSLFPIRDRDFYDASRGPVQERRQLFVPTGEEVGSLENVNGVITQTSYEPYNEFLSVKIVQTYKVDGPQLIGNATDNEGQLVTVTTQRKAAKDYVAPNPTATRTVEVNREDAESLVERIVDTPEIFAGKLFAKEANDPAPLKFRVAAPATTEETTLAGQAQEPSLATGDISKSEQQISKFLKRVRSTFRSLLSLPVVLTQKSTNNEKNLVSITQTLQAGDTAEQPSATKSVESEALGDGTYVVTVSEAPVFAGQVYRATKEDLTPQKFKAAQSETTFEQTIVGDAAAVTLGTGEFAKSEEQINKFLKRVSTTSRVIATTSVLNELVLTNEGQVGTRKLTLASGPQTFTPSATLIDASVEALGDGRTVKTETTVPNVFAGKTITKTKADLTPEKFKAKQEDITTEESVAGTVATSLTLGPSEFRKSEQQVTEFVKRTSTTTRDTTAAVDLEEVVLTPQGQLATRTLRLSSDAQTITPDATFIDGSIEELGDGRTIKTEVRVPFPFDGLTLTASKPDVIPPAFRASVPTQTTEEIIEADNALMPELEEDDIEASEQRLTEFTVRSTKTTRDNKNLPTLEGQEYDPQTNTIVRFSERVVKSGTQTGNATRSVDPLSDEYDLVRQFDLTSISSQLDSIMLEFPTRASLSIPPILKSLTIRYETTKEDGAYSNSLIDAPNLGNNSNAQSGSASAQCAIRPVFQMEKENVYASNLPTTSYIFFLKYPVTIGAILAKVNAQQWPVFRPKSHTVTATGESKTITVSGSYSKSSSVLDKTGNVTTLAIEEGRGSGVSAGSSNSTTVLEIEPCLHGEIQLEKPDAESEITAQAVISFSANIAIPPIGRGNTIKAVGKCDVTLTPTNPPDIPRTGRYLIDSRVDLYQYGYARIYAEVLDASIFADPQI